LICGPSATGKEVNVRKGGASAEVVLNIETNKRKEVGGGK
jgi:hypothetical protein